MHDLEVGKMILERNRTIEGNAAGTWPKAAQVYPFYQEISIQESD